MIVIRFGVELGSRLEILPAWAQCVGKKDIGGGRIVCIVCMMEKRTKHLMAYA